MWQIVARLTPILRATATTSVPAPSNWRAAATRSGVMTLGRPPRRPLARRRGPPGCARQASRPRLSGQRAEHLEGQPPGGGGNVDRLHVAGGTPHHAPGGRGPWRQGAAVIGRGGPTAGPPACPCRRGDGREAVQLRPGDAGTAGTLDEHACTLAAVSASSCSCGSCALRPRRVLPAVKLPLVPAGA